MDDGGRRAENFELGSGNEKRVEVGMRNVEKIEGERLGRWEGGMRRALRLLNALV